MFHAPLRTCRDDIFFKVCKLHNVAYNPELKTGVLFFLVDAVASGVLSMLVMGGPIPQSDSMTPTSPMLRQSEGGMILTASRVGVLQMAVTALTFIYQNFGKGDDAELPSLTATADQISAASCYHLSTILIKLRRQLKREQKYIEKKK